MDVYPNPAKVIANITVPEDYRGIIQIYSAQGKLLKTVDTNTGRHISLDLSEFEAGLLYIKAGNYRKKLIVVK